MKLTVLEISQKIGTAKNPVTTDATRRRIKNAGYEPCQIIGVNKIYDLSEADIEILKNRSVVGHPKANSPPPKNPNMKKKKNK